MYGLGPVPFKDGCAVASTDTLSRQEVILLTSEEGKVRRKLEVNWGRQAGANARCGEVAQFFQPSRID